MLLLTSSKFLEFDMGVLALFGNFVSNQCSHFIRLIAKIIANSIVVPFTKKSETIINIPRALKFAIGLSDYKISILVFREKVYKPKKLLQ